MAGLQLYREVIRIVRTLPLNKQIQKKIKYNVKELIVFRHSTPEEPKHSKFIMRREPKHQVQEEDEGEGLPRELKMERWAHQGAEDVNLLRELSMLDAETKKKIFSTFVEKPMEVKNKRVDKFESIKGRLLRDKYQEY